MLGCPPGEGALRIMRRKMRRTLALLAIAAIALHSVLWSAGAPLAAARVDPFSVICHTETQGMAPDARIPGGDTAPAQPCDHCTLCSAAVPPAALDTVLAGTLEPARLLQILRHLPSAARSSFASGAKLARGPPSFA
jgi:hypothetical protein